MLTTCRADWAERARRLREHAMSIGAAERHSNTLPSAEEYLEVGYNFRMTDVQAAIGLAQLSKLDVVVARRRALAANYQRELAGVPGLRCVADPEDAAANYQSFWIEIGPIIHMTVSRCWPVLPPPTYRRAGASWRPIASPPTPVEISATQRCGPLSVSPTTL